MSESEPAIDAETLLRHAHFVRALARSLLRDEHRVDDIVQETMLAAWRRRAALRGDVRAWLATVVRNGVRMLRRSEVRRGDRERRVAMREATRSTASTAARLEIQRRLVKAVEALDEPYRSTIVLRFFDGEMPRVIARRQNVSVKTVQTRLRRALERLRGMLDAAYGGERRAWCAALLPAALASPPSVTAGSAVSTTIGVLLMKTKLTVAALVLVVGVLVYLAWPDHATRGERVATSDTPAARKVAPPKASPNPAAEDAANPTPDTTPPSRDGTATRKIVAGKVLLEVPGRDYKTRISAFRVTKHGHTDTTREPLTSESTREGDFELDVTPLLEGFIKEIEVRADHPRHLPARTRITVVGETAGVRVHLALKPAAVALGRIEDPGGNPIADARVALFRLKEGAPASKPLDRVQTGPDGGYRLRFGEGGRYLVAATAESWRPAHATADLTVGEETTVPDLRLPGGLSITGRITVNGAVPPRGAGVRARHLDPAGRRLSFESLFWSEGTLRRSAAESMADTEGRYELGGLEPGSWEVRGGGVHWIHADAYQNPGPRRLATPPTTGVDIDFSAAWLQLWLEVTDADVSAAHVLVTGATSSYGARPSSDGRVQVAVQPGTSYKVRATLGGFEPIEFTVVAPMRSQWIERRVALSPLRPRTSLRVRLTGGAGPMLRAGFGFFVEGRSRPAFTRDGESPMGRFEFRDLEPGSYRLAVHPGSVWQYPLAFYLPTERHVQLPEGGTVDLEIPIRRGGRIRFEPETPQERPERYAIEIRDASGRLRQMKYLRQHNDGSWISSKSYVWAREMEAVPALAAGNYQIRLSRDGFREKVLSVEVREAAVTTVTLVPLEPE